MGKLHIERLAKLEMNAKALARVLDHRIARLMGEPTGFALMLFSIDGPEAETTWVSNASREEMTRRLEAFVSRLKADQVIEF
jgi:hypothetical protein